MNTVGTGTVHNYKTQKSFFFLDSFSGIFTYDLTIICVSGTFLIFQVRYLGVDGDIVVKGRHHVREVVESVLLEHVVHHLYIHKN
jgi:hypothetical protein